MEPSIDDETQEHADKDQDQDPQQDRCEPSYGFELLLGLGFFAEYNTQI